MPFDTCAVSPVSFHVKWVTFFLALSRSSNTTTFRNDCIAILRFYVFIIAECNQSRCQNIKKNARENNVPHCTRPVCALTGCQCFAIIFSFIVFYAVLCFLWEWLANMQDFLHLILYIFISSLSLHTFMDVAFDEPTVNPFGWRDCQSIL